MVLAWPGVSLFILAIIFGAYVFVDGIFTLVAAVNYKAGAGRRTWLFIRGIAGIIVGLITFFWPAITALALVMLIAAWALVTGVMELVFAFRANQNTAIRWMFAISGILSLILGALMLAQPYNRSAGYCMDNRSLRCTGRHTAHHSRLQTAQRQGKLKRHSFCAS